MWSTLPQIYVHHYRGSALGQWATAHSFKNHYIMGIIGNAAMLFWIFFFYCIMSGSGDCVILRCVFCGNCMEIVIKKIFFVWLQELAVKIMLGIEGWIKLGCMCTLTVSSFSGNSKLPCKSFHLKQKTFLSLWIWPQDCYSLVTDIPLSRTIILSRSHSHTLLIPQMQWNFLEEKKKQRPGHVRIKHRNIRL